MKRKMTIALTLSILVTASAVAGEVYRWTNPETGEVLVTTTPPPYPIKEKRVVGSLPNSDMVELIFDSNAPEVKALIEKRNAREQERKRIAQEKAREQAAREAEQERIAQEKAREQAAREAEQKRIAQERAREQAAREAEQKRIAQERAREQAAREAERRKQIEAQEAEEKRVAAEEMQKVQRKMDQVLSKKGKEKDIDFMINIIDEFKQYNKFASSTARINLAIPINNLLNTKVKLDSYEIPKCYASSKSQLQSWMDFTIKSYYAFSAKEEYQSENYMLQADEQFKKFWLDFPDSCSIF